MAVRQRLEALLLDLFQGDARAANGALAALLPDLGPILPGLDTPREQFVGALLDAVQGRDLLSDLRLKLRQARPNHPAIDEVLLRAQAARAFDRDGIKEPRNLDTCDLHAVVHAHARPDSHLQAWLEEYAPGFSPDLPPVLYLVRQGDQLTAASLRRAGQPDLPIHLPASPGACGLHLSDGNAWARAIGQLAQRLSLPDTAHLVIVVEAEPEDTDAGLADQPYPGSPHPLYGRFTALAWWPRSEWPADGRIHDGPLPAPGPAIAHWRKAPTPKQERAADLGVWAAPGVWSPSSACPVLGRHDRRYFAVCGKKPPRGPISLTDLFQHARGHLLLWTDRRYHLTPGSHLP